MAMTVAKIPMSVDQLTWGFTDVSNAGGKFVLWWDTVMASAPLHRRAITVGFTEP